MWTESAFILQSFQRSARAFHIICHYLQSEELRREIQEGLNVVENWNSATNFIHFGRHGEFSTNKLEDQELAMLALHLLQISLTFIQTLMIQEVLSEPAWMSRMTKEDLRGLTPFGVNLRNVHVNN